MNVIILILLSAIAIYFWHRINIEFDDRKDDETIANQVQELLDKCPYQVMFRDSKCKKYSKYNCHIAIDATTRENILVIDIDE